MIRQTHRARSSRQFYLATAMTALFAWAGQADALPMGFQVIGGTAVQDPSVTAPNMTIDQSSNRAVINWSSFNIGSGETVHFAQPSKNAIAFNVIPAGAGVTNISGTLTATGGVWLFSPGGFVFGAGSVVSTPGSFLASTGIFNATSQTEAMNESVGVNQIQIFAPPTSTASIGVDSGAGNTTNASIIADGFVLLNGATITQDGSVTSNTDAVVYDADQGITVKFTPQLTGPSSTPNGLALNDVIATPGVQTASSVESSGSTTAQTFFEADVAGEVTQPGFGIINLSGEVQASGMKATGNPSDPTNGYSVILDAESTGPASGPVTSTIESMQGCMTGSISSASGIFARAGTITTGAWANDAGAVTLQAANAVTIPDGTALTNASGPINIDPNGPVDVEGQINSGTSVFIAATNVLLGADGAISAGPNAPQSGMISTSSGTATVTLQSYATNGDAPVAPGTAGGNIMIGAPLSWATSDVYGGALTLSAYNSLIVSAPITASDPQASVFLNTAQGGSGDYSFVNGGSLSYTGTADFGQRLSINGAQYELIFNQADLLEINDPNNVFANVNGDHFALAAPLDFAAGGTATVFTGAPIAPTVYAPFTGTFTGLGNTISNLNIQNVTPIGQSTPNGNGGTNGALGLFGFVGSGGLIRDVNLSNATITGGDGIRAGALVGNLDGTVMNVSSSGQVTVGDGTYTSTGQDYGDQASAFAGGLVGYSDGQIINGHSSATVTAGGIVEPTNSFAGSTFAGGLVGQLTYGGAISNSSASGAVTVGDNTGEIPVAGGLVGGTYNAGAITSSSATGAVTGGDGAIVGGFAGELEYSSPVSGSFATGAVNGGAGSQAGGFAGVVDTSDVNTSYATGAVTQTVGGSGGVNNSAGGFVGLLLHGSSITQSYSSGAVQTVGGADSGSSTFAGGFAGDVDTSSTISNAYSLGSVSSGSGAFADTGGFAGIVQESSGIDHVYATGHVTGAGQVAGLVAVLGNHNDADKTGSLTDSYWDVGTTGQGGLGYNSTTPTGPNDHEGTASAVIAVGAGTTLSPYATATYGNFGADLTTGAGTWVMIPGETRPMLSSEYSTTITNAHQLQLMGLNLAANYTVANDIDASETTSAAGIWNPANGFVPVGGNGAASFTGTFNGQGYTISNLTIKFTTADQQNPVPSLTTDGVVGLFGFVGPTGVLENVNLIGAQVTAGDGMLAGALAGGSLGLVTNASSSGSVTVGNEINSGGGITAEAGGLVGGSAGTITNSTSSATVTGGNAFAGGLLGSEGIGGVVTNASASGAVSVTSYPAGFPDSPDAGGLIGEMDNATVAGSFATGAVSGGAGAHVGGLIGNIDDGVVTTSYATGNVLQTAGGVANSNAAAGGFAGEIEDGSSVTNSYASGDVTSVAAAASGEFSRAGGFAGAIEDSGTNVSDSYALGSVSMTGSGAGFSTAGGFVGAVTGEGSASDVYATGAVSGSGAGVNVGGLAGQVGANDNGVPSGGSITDSYWDEGTTHQTTGVNLFGSAAPEPTVIGIGGMTGPSPYAQATYANFDFTNTWFMVEGSTRPILQSEYSTTITNAHQLQLVDLNLAANYTLGSNIDATNVDGASGIWNPATGFSPIGATAAAPFTGTFDGQGHNVTNLTIVDATPVQQFGSSGEETFGAVGLFGSASGTIENVNLVNAKVTGADGMEVGALVGDLSGTVSNASSSGTITVGDVTDVADARAGGLVGDLTGAIMNSSSSAGVTGGDADIGGLIGKSIGGTATGSFATGNVVGGAGSTAGGLIGFGDNFTVSYSYATGSVTQTTAGGNWAGGFAGGLEFSTVNSSFATGAVSTVGTSNNPALAGGFVANLLSTTVNNAYAAGPVTVTGPDDIAGGFAGTVGLASVVNNVYSIGAVDPESPGATKGGLFGTVSDAPQPDLAEGAEPSITDAYWNSSTTGQTSAYGAVIGSPSIDVADVSGDPYNPASYPGFNFGGPPGVTPVWSIPSESFYPQLYGASHVLNVTAQDTEITYGDYPVYTLAVTGLQGGDTIASAVQGFVVQPLDPQNDNATPSVGYSGYYNVNNNDNDPYEIYDPYDLSIAQTIVASGQTGSYRPIYNDNVNISDGALLIDPVPLTVAAVYDERPYDGAMDSSGQPTVSGLVPGDGIYDNETDGGPTQSFGGADAGAQTLYVNSFTVADGNTFAQGANYTVTTTSTEGQIDPETIIIGAVTDSKTYDGTTNSSQTPTIVSGQLYGQDADDTVSGTQAFESKDVMGTDGSTLYVVNYSLELADPNNYSISETTATASGTITPAALLLDAAGDSKVYDGTTSSTAMPTVDSSTPVFGNDSVTGLTQAFASKDVLGMDGSTLNVTGYSVNDGNGGADYTVTLAPAVGTITPAPLLIDATGDSRVYNGTTSSTALPTIDSTTPVLGTDTVTNLTQAFASKDVLGMNGSTLNVTGYSVNDGNGGNDYSVTLAPAVGTITPFDITLSATSDTKVYDGTTDSGQAPTASQLFQGDSLVATQSFASKDVITDGPSTLVVNPGYSIDDGNGGADYNITNVYTAQGAITPASLLIDAAGDSRVYNGTTSSTGMPTIDPSTQVFGNDTVTGLTQAFASKDVLGTNGSTLNVTGYTINDGNNGNDYTVTTAAAYGTITPASLLIDAAGDSRVYNGTTSSTGMPTIDSTTPVLGTDTVTGLTQAFASKDVLGTNGSTLNVTGYTINDGNNGNDYTVTTATAYGTITPFDITLSATSDTKVYDGTTDSGQAPTASQLFQGDSLVATQSFASKDVITDGPSTLVVNPGYSIDDGNGGADYNITNVYTAQGMITPLALTASLTGTVQKVYDGTTGATLTSANYSLPGVIGEDDVSLNDPTSGTYNNRNAGTGKLVTVNGLQISGDDAEDYALSSTTASGAVGVITAAPLTLTAVTDTRTYDGGVTSSGTPTNSALIEGDSVSGLVQSFASKNALGTGGSTLLVTGYTIDDGNGGANYAVTLVNARGTINPAPLTIAAVTDTKTYDGTAASSATPTYSTLYGGDTVTGLVETYDSKNAGARALSVTGYTINDGNDGGDYIVTTTTAAGEIDQKALTAALIGNVQKAYDGNTAATLASTNYSLPGVVSGDDVSLNDPASGTYDNPNAGTLKLVSVDGLALSGADAANYTVNGAAAGDIGTITAPPQTLQITVPTQDVTTPGFLQTATDAAGAVQNTINNTTTVVNVFPVGNDNNNAAQGDNLPITGTGNLDLWTTSEDSDQACPPGAPTPCPPSGGSH